MSETNLVLLINESRFPKRLGNRVGIDFYFNRMNNLALDNLNIQPLGNQELVEIDGGIAPLVYVGAMALGFAVGVCIRVLS